MFFGRMNVWGQDVGDILFLEQFTVEKNTQANAYDFGGTTTYNNSTAGLTYTSSSTSSIVSSSSASGLDGPTFFFVASGTSSLTMSGISLAQGSNTVTKITISFKCNKTNTNATYSFDGSTFLTGKTSINGTQSFDVDCTGKKTLYLKFENTSTSVNSRIDDVKIVVAAIDDCTTPTVDTENGTYTIGGSALDLNNKILSDNTNDFTFSCLQDGCNISGNSFTATKAGTYTISAHQDADDTYCTVDETFDIIVSATITWSINGTEIEETYTNVKPVPTLGAPTASDCNPVKAFVGWTTEKIETATDTKPTPLYSTAELPAVTEDETYYAVFATIIGGEEVWTLTPLSDITEGVYAIVYHDNGYAFSGTISSGHGQPTSTEFTFVDGVAKSAPSDVCELTLTKSGSEFTLYNADRGYLYITAASSGNLAWKGTKGSSGWKYASENWMYAGVSNARVRSATSNTFRSYGNNSGNGAIRLAKKTSATSESGYITECVPPCIYLDKPTLYDATEITSSSVKLSWSSVTGAISYLLTYTPANGETIEQDVSNVTSYTLTGLEAETGYAWTVKAIGDGTNYCDSEESKATGEFTTEPASFDGKWTIDWQQTAGASEWARSCFEGTMDMITGGDEFKIENFTLPTGNCQFWVGYEGVWGTHWGGSSNTVSFSGHITFVNSQSAGKNPYPGDGAWGTLRIYGNSDSENKYIAFIPKGYNVTYGIEDGAAWTDVPFTWKEGTTWETAEVEIANTYDAANTKYYTGATKANGTTAWGGKSNTIAMSGLYDKMAAGVHGIFRMSDAAGEDGDNFSTTFIPYYNILYHDENGNFTESSVYISSQKTDAERTITLPSPIREGWTFLGWSEEKDDTPELNPGGEYKLWEPNTKLYQVWKENIYTVTWMVNGIPYTSNVKEGVNPTQPEAANTTGTCDYQFKGWTATPITTSQATAPTDLFNSETAPEAANAESPKTYYAVFAQVIEDNTPETWSVVSNESTLQVGDQVIIVATDYNLAMSTEQKSNNRGQADYTKGTIPAETVQIFTLEVGTKSDTWSFCTSAGYIYAASSSSNYLKTHDTKDDNSSFSISIGNNNYATITAQGTNTRNTIWYNADQNSGQVFSCYSTTSNKPISLYKKSGGYTITKGDYVTSYTCNLHTLTIAATEGGTTTPTTGTVIDGYEGKKINISATVTMGYTFAYWTFTGTGASIADPTAPTTTLTMGTEDVTVTANFVSATTDKYILVTDASTLVAGDILLIADNTSNVVAANEIGARLLVTPATFAANTITGLGTNPLLLTLGGTTYNWTLTNSNNGQLSTNTTASNFQWDNIKNDANTWKIKITGSNAKLISNHTHENNTTRQAYFNTETWGFVYQSNNPLPEEFRDIQLYRKNAIASISVDAKTARYLAGTEKVTIEKVTATYYDGTEKEVTGLTDANFTGYDLSTASETPVTVTVTYTENGKTVTTTYDVTVEEPENILFKIYDDVIYTAEGLSGTTLTPAQIEEAEAAARAEVCNKPYEYNFVGWSDAQGKVNEIIVDTSTKILSSADPFYAIYKYSEDGEQITLINDDFITDNADERWTISGSGLTFKGDGKVTIGSGTYGGYIEQKLPITAGTFVTVTVIAKRGNNTKDDHKLSVTLGETALVTDLKPEAEYTTYTYTANAPTDNPVLHFGNTALNQRVDIDKIIVTAGGALLQTTKPECGAYLGITTDEDIYVTSGVGTHSTVHVQQKIYFEGYRLKPDTDGDIPRVYVYNTDISSSTVKLDLTHQTATPNGKTYDIEGYAIVQYTPTEANSTEDVTINFKAHYNSGIVAPYTVHTRALPTQFVIAAKDGEQWYALPADMASAGVHDAKAITVNESGTEVLSVPSSAIYTFDGMPNSAESDKTYVRFIGNDGKYLEGSIDDANIRNGVITTPTGATTVNNWQLNTTDNATYTIGIAAQEGRTLSLDASNKWGINAPAEATITEIRFLPISAAGNMVIENGDTWSVTKETTLAHLEVNAGAKVEVAADATLNVASITLRSDFDEVPQLEMNGSLHVANQSLKLIKHIDDQRYYFFSVPYDYSVTDVKIDGTGNQYAKTWIAAHYDGEKRTETSGKQSSWVNLMNLTTLEAGKGYSIALATGTPAKDLEFTFNLASTDLSADNDKEASYAVTAHGKDDKDLHHSNIGWNFVAQPFLNEHTSVNDDAFSMPTPAEWMKYVAIPQVGSNQVYLQHNFSDLGKDKYPSMLPFTGFFVQVAESGSVVFTKGNASPSSMLAPQRVAAEQPLVIGLSLSNSAYTDVTSLVIGNQFTDAYEIGSDFEKLLGIEQYPQFYSHDASYRYAFKSISKDAAAQTIPLGVYLPEATEYTIALKDDVDVSRLQGVYLTDYIANMTVNLMQSEYTFTSAKEHTDKRFAVSALLSADITTDLINTTTWTAYQDAPLHIRIIGINAGDRVRVIDITGKVLYTTTANSFYDEISLPQAGVYCIETVGKAGLQIKKVMVK